MDAEAIEALKARRAYTPAAALVAERGAWLDRVEADRSQAWPEHWPATVKRGMQWTIWRAGDGAFAFDLDVAEALDTAGYFREAVAWWEEHGSPGMSDALRRGAETPWTDRTPVAVARGTGMHRPDSADAPHAFRRARPDNPNGFATITAAALIATPEDFADLRIHVEPLD